MRNYLYKKPQQRCPNDLYAILSTSYQPEGGGNRAGWSKLESERPGVSLLHTRIYPETLSDHTS